MPEEKVNPPKADQPIKTAPPASRFNGIPRTLGGLRNFALLRRQPQKAVSPNPSHGEEASSQTQPEEDLIKQKENEEKTTGSPEKNTQAETDPEKVQLVLDRIQEELDKNINRKVKEFRIENGNIVIDFEDSEPSPPNSNLSTPNQTAKAGGLRKAVGPTVAAGLTAATIIGGQIGLNAVGNHVEAAGTHIAPNYANVLTPTSRNEAPIPTTTATRAPNPAMPAANEKTTEAKKNPEAIGNKNVAEFLMGNLPEQFKQIRMERLNNDPDFAKAMLGDARDEDEKQKIMKEIVQSDRINFVFMVIDETRERPNEYSATGQGRSDVMMVVSFDPHTFETILISVPRDLYSPTANDRADNQNTPAKINHLSLHEKDSDPVIRKELEYLTSLPIDAIAKINIDGVQGYIESGINRPGFLNALIPKNGLKITTEEVYDPNFPTENYGTKVFHMPAGEHVFMPTDDLTPLIDYTRSRATADSATGRDRRQRQVAIALVQQLLPQVFDDIKDGESHTVDNLINILEWQKAQGNLFSNVELIEILKTMKTSQQELTKPQNALVLAKLLSNTLPALAGLKDSIHHEGLGRNNLLTDVQAGEGEINNTYALLKPQGKNITEIKNIPDKGERLLKYYENVRKHFRSMLI